MAIVPYGSTSSRHPPSGQEAQELVVAGRDILYGRRGTRPLVTRYKLQRQLDVGDGQKRTPRFECRGTLSQTSWSVTVTDNKIVQDRARQVESVRHILRRSSSIGLEAASTSSVPRLTDPPTPPIGSDHGIPATNDNRGHTSAHSEG